jgi:hypothetical protein
MIRWTVIVLASLSWLFAMHHYVAPSQSNGWIAPLVGENVATWMGAQATQWVFVVAATLLGVVGMGRGARDERLGMAWSVLALPVLAALMIALPAYRPGLIVLAIGFVTLLMGGLSSSNRVARAALIVGSVLVLQSAGYWMATTWMAKNPHVPGVGQVLYWLLSWVGADVSFSGGVLFVRMMREVHVFPILWEHVGLFVLLQLWVGGAVLIWLTGDRVGSPLRFVRLTLSLAVYAILRLFVLIPIFVTAMLFVGHDAETVHVEIFWLPWIQAVSWLPIIFVLARTVPVCGGGPAATANEPRLMPHWTALGVGLLVVIATASGVVGKYYWEPGEVKEGRILLDEAHSEWERTDKPYDTEWYGHESGYNYYCMAQYLRHFYTLDFNMDGELTAELLAQYDVLILKTPTKRYSPEELDAIEDFVRDGGGVFAFGEHTNVFGTSVCLNEIMQRFGLAFRYDSVFDITRKWEQVHIPQGRSEQLLASEYPLGVHPSIQDVPFFRFAVSCSVSSEGWNARPVVRSTGLWSLPIEYAASNFYPRVEDKTYAMFGGFDQIVCSTVGRGRVIAFGDSTVYSNFLAFYPGKPEFLLGGVDWLNRRNALPAMSVNHVAYLAAGALVLIVLLLASRMSPHVGLLGLTAAIAASVGWGGIYACTQQTRADYPTPRPHTAVDTIVFDVSHGSGALPLFAFADTKNLAQSYEIFYQWVLRLGYYTDVSFDLESALAGNRPIVIMQPNAEDQRLEVTPEVVESLRSFLQAGGSVLILDGANNVNSTANAMLEPFGMRLSDATSSMGIALSPGGVQICDLQRPMLVEGGEPLLVDRRGAAVLAWKQVGAGQLIVGGIANRLSDLRMGGSSRSVPDQRMRIVYELEFALLRGMVKGDVAGELAALFAALSPGESGE